MRYVWAVVAIGLSLAAGRVAAGEREAAERERMLQDIAADVRQTRLRLGKAALEPRVFEALRTVPRHVFVPSRVRHLAYANRPLPIGYGQTISQPYIVAVMTDLLEVEPDDVVLEIGTGSGYQTAVLATLARQVYSVEIIAPLAEQARQRLHQLGYANVAIRIGDGYYGWAAHAPFDGIMVTAAARHVPPPLLQQLKPGGRLVIPVGGPFMTQHLMLVRKTADGQIRMRQVLPVAFVPLRGEH